MSEKTLWQEVLLRAVMDARLDPAAEPIPKDALHDTAKARDYLTTPSKDLATVCSLAGVDMEALIDRMRRKVADLPALDLDKAKPTRNRGALYEHAGRSLTVNQWSEITGISAGVIHDRLHRGLTVADALTIPLKRRSGSAPKITYQGETLTHHEWAERTGLSWFTIRDRVRKGWPVEEVLRFGDLRGVHMRVEAA